MDKNQKSCILFAIDARPIELYVPEVTEGPKFHIWRLVTSGPFENFILSLIIGNTLLLMLKVSRIRKRLSNPNFCLCHLWRVPYLKVTCWLASAFAMLSTR